ncbi:MAG TPA: YcgN family cysteine cluster protein [Anaerolineaceae bacterium]
MLEPEFWKKKTLEAMNRVEWEALCDGCARCCLYKLQDEDTGEVFYTNVVCRLLNLHTCRCNDYRNRSTLVPTCLTLDPSLARSLTWMPETCAYRLLAEGKDLPAWHPLVSNDPEAVHRAGISLRRQWLIEERYADMDNLEKYIVDTL